MSEIKIGLGQLGKIVAGAGAGGEPVQPGLGKNPDAPPPPADGFRGTLLKGAGAAAAQLTGQAQGLPLPANELAAGARQLLNPADVQGRFEAAFAAIKDQLLDHPGLLPEDLGQRANEFFTEYAKAFVQTASEPPPPAQQQTPEQPQKAPEPEARAQTQEQGQAQAENKQERPLSAEQQRALAREFADSLRALGFQALKNLANGKDGVENGFQLLTAEGLKEFLALAKEQKISVQGEFPPRLDGELPPPQPETGAEKAEPGGEKPAPMDARPATERDRTGNKEEPDLPPGGTRAHEDEEDGPRTRKKLGKNMLFNWLHTFRRRDEAVRQAEEKWDRVAVAALLFLLFLTLVTVALVSL